MKTIINKLTILIIVCLFGGIVSSCGITLGTAYTTQSGARVAITPSDIDYYYDYYGYYPYVYYNRYNGRYYIDYYDYYYRYPWRSNIYINIPHKHHKPAHHSDYHPAPKPHHTPSHTPGPGRRHDGPAVTPKPANGKPAVKPSSGPHRTEPTYHSTPSNNNHRSISPTNGNGYRSTGSSNASSSRVSPSRGSNTNNSHSTSSFSRSTSSNGGRGGRR